MKHTLLSITASLALATAVLGQDERASSPAFEEALVVEELEHDLPGAALRYAALAGDSELPEALRRRAWLRLGRVEAARGNVPAARAALGEAAKGTDSVAEEARARLADPGQDEERARALADKARAALATLMYDVLYNKWLPTELPQSAKDLLWIGTAAVPEIIRALEERRHEPPSDQVRWQTPALSALLWRIGGSEAHAYLTDLCGHADVTQRRIAARGLQACPDLEADLLELAQTLLSDPDPEGLVPILAFNGQLRNEPWGFHRLYERYDALQVVRALDSAAAPARAHILKFFAEKRPDLFYAPKFQLFMAELAPRISRALDDVDPEVGQAAETCLASMGLSSPDIRKLLLERLPSLPITFNGFMIQESGPIEPTEHAELMLGTLLQLPPARTEAPTNRDNSVRQLGEHYFEWHREALPTLIEWAARGYDLDGRLGGWVEWKCEPEDAIALCAGLATRPAFRSVIPWLASIDPPAECLAGLLLAESKLLEEYAAGSRQGPSVWQPGLFLAMARTGRVEVAEHLSNRLTEGRESRQLHSLYSSVAEALMFLSARNDDQRVRDALCDLLVFEVPTTSHGIRFGTSQTRNQVLGQLVRLGERRVVDLLPRAYDLGLERQFAWDGDGEGRQPTSMGLHWLAVYYEDSGSAEDWHGFGADDISAIWSDLLGRDPEDWNTSWALAIEALHAKSIWPQTNAEPQPDLAPPPGIVTAFARAWIERAAVDPDRPASIHLGGLITLLDMRQHGILEDDAALAALEDLQAACFEARSAKLRQATLQALGSGLGKAERARVLELLFDPDANVASSALDVVFREQMPIDRALLARVLAEGTWRIQQRAIHSIAPLVADGAVELVTTLLQDPLERTRISACEYLGMQVDRNSVPDLLQVLKDPLPKVRNAAAQALKDIRFYHDQKAHWDRVFAGTELGPAGAAEKLLRQAAPDQAEEIRLLAIRSLGQLGVPEALPFLIDWSRSERAAIAQAAREAITRIHEAGD